MNISKKLLSEKKWAFMLIFFILLFTPTFYFWANNINMKDKCLAWVTCIVVGLAFSCIDLFLKKRGEKIYLSILFILSIFPNLIVWGYLYLSNLCMKHDMFWVIFITHKSESEEYISEFFTWKIFVAIGVYILLGFFFLFKAHSKNALSIKKHTLIFVLSIAIILTGIILRYTSQAIPTFDFYKSRILFWQADQVFQKEKEMRKSLKMDVQCLLPHSTKHNVIIILGESTSTCHMSLYGYHRKTTPLMDAYKDEISVYQDIVTPENHTFGAMQKILSFANHEHPEYYRQKPSLIEVFNSAGFDTYWVSNHALLTKWGGSYGIIAQEAKHLDDFSPLKQPDEALLPGLDEALNDNTSRNKVIFIHLMGNHHAYNCRYPKEFEHFDHKRDQDLPDLGFRDDDSKQTIDEYDNSILYGDFVFSAILERLKKEDAPSCLLFFSDHGEEVNETRKAKGHFMTDVYPCQARVPFVFWQSENYKKEVPEIVIDPMRPYSIENVIYSLATVCRLKFNNNQQDKSIFSSEYKVPEIRWVGKEDYKDILKKVNPKK